MSSDDDYFDQLLEEYNQTQAQEAEEGFKFKCVKYTVEEHSKLKYKKICARGKAIDIAAAMRHDESTMEWPASKRQKVAASMAYYPGTAHGPLDRDQSHTFTEEKKAEDSDDEFADRCDRLFWGWPDWNAKNYKDFYPSPIQSPLPVKIEKQSTYQPIERQQATSDYGK